MISASYWDKFVPEKDDRFEFPAVGRPTFSEACVQCAIHEPVLDLLRFGDVKWGVDKHRSLCWRQSLIFHAEETSCFRHGPEKKEMIQIQRLSSDFDIDDLI